MQFIGSPDSASTRSAAAIWLIFALALFVPVAFFSLEGIAPGVGRFGGLLSGGWIPLLNMLVALKVTLGSWAMVQRFIQYRGLL